MTPHFSDEELTCRCGCGMLPQVDFMKKIEELRNRVGFSLPVSSAARCPKHNDKVSKTGLDGPHTTGRAIDILVDRKSAFLVLETAIKMGCFTGIGIQQKGASRFIHLDDLIIGRPTVWSY